MNSDDPFLIARMAMALLERLPQRDGGRVVLVSSARAGEGKTFIAGLLARELAAQGDGEVVLVEAAPSAGTAPLGGSVGGGFMHLLGQGELPPEALRATETAGLLRLPFGASAAAAGATRAQWLFQPQAVQRALQALRQRFALAVLDAPTLAGCGALAQEADSVLLVVNAKRTPRHAIEQAMATARVDPSRMAGVVLNRHVRELPRWLGGR